MRRWHVTAEQSVAQRTALQCTAPQETAPQHHATEPTTKRAAYAVAAMRCNSELRHLMPHCRRSITCCGADSNACALTNVETAPAALSGPLLSGWLILYRKGGACGQVGLSGFPLILGQVQVPDHVLVCGGRLGRRVPTSGGLAGPRAPTSGKCAMQFFSSPCVFLNTSPANVGSLHLGRIPNCSEVPDIDVCRRVPTSGRGVVPRVPTCGLPHTNTTSGRYPAQGGGYQPFWVSGWAEHCTPPPPGIWGGGWVGEPKP